MKKLISSALVLSVLLSAIVSCGGEGRTANEAGGNIVSDTAESENGAAVIETAAETEADPYAGIDMGGIEFRVIQTEGVEYGTPQFDFESLSGDSVQDAIYTRNRTMEEKLNFRLTVTENKDYANVVQKSVRAGEDAYDAVMNTSDLTASWIASGILYNMLDIPTISFDSPWWDTEFNNGLILNKKYLYQMSGSISPGVLIRSVALAFRTGTVKDNGLPLPYDTVREGRWTYDEMDRYARTCQNLNGESSYGTSGRSFWGYATFGGWISVAAIAAGQIVKLDENGTPYFAGADEALVNAYERMQQSFSGDGMTSNGGGDYASDYIAFYKDNRALFMVSAIGNMIYLRDMDAEYGILPMPKFTEDGQYLNSLGSSFILGVPATNGKIDKTGTILDCLGRYGMDNVIPVYYDSLCYRGMRDNDSIEMLNIINAGLVSDLGRFYGWTVQFLDGIGDKLIKGKLNVVSEMEKNASRIQKSIDKTMAELNG